MEWGFSEIFLSFQKKKKFVNDFRFQSVCMNGRMYITGVLQPFCLYFVMKEHWLNTALERCDRQCLWNAFFWKTFTCTWAVSEKTRSMSLLCGRCHVSFLCSPHCIFVDRTVWNRTCHCDPAAAGEAIQSIWSIAPAKQNRGSLRLQK